MSHNRDYSRSLNWKVFIGAYYLLQQGTDCRSCPHDSSKKKTARMWEWEEKYLDRQYQFFDLLSQKQDGNVSLTSPSFCTLKASIHRLLFDVAWAAGLQAGYWGRGGSCRLYKRTQAKPFIMALRWCLCIVALRAVQCLCQSHLSCFHMLNYSITCIPWGAGQYCMCNSALGEAQRAKSAVWVKF